MKPKASDILQKIKGIISSNLKFDDMPAQEPANQIVLTTNDGVQVSVNKLEVGGIATINGMPAPANTYAFTDGSSITTDAAGSITAFIPAPAQQQQSTQPAAQPPAATPVATQPAAQPVAQTMQSQQTENAPARFLFTDEHKTPEGIDKLFAAFATGSAEERIANLEVVAKALMEYSFGWEIRQAKEKSERDAAIKIYTDTLAPLQLKIQEQEKEVTAYRQAFKEMVTLVEGFMNEPVSNPPVQTKKAFSFGIERKEKAKGSIGRYADAAKKIAEQKASATA